MKTLNKNTPRNAPEMEILNNAPEVTAEQEAIETQTQEQVPEAEIPFNGLSLDVKKQLITIRFREAQSGIF